MTVEDWRVCGFWQHFGIQIDNNSKRARFHLPPKNLARSHQFISIYICYILTIEVILGTHSKVHIWGGNAWNCFILARWKASNMMRLEMLSASQVRIARSRELVEQTAAEICNSRYQRHDSLARDKCYIWYWMSNFMRFPDGLIHVSLRLFGIYIYFFYRFQVLFLCAWQRSVSSLL